LEAIDSGCKYLWRQISCGQLFSLPPASPHEIDQLGVFALFSGKFCVAIGAILEVLCGDFLGKFL